MPETLIGSTDYGDKLNQQEDFSVDTQTLDAAGDQKETTYFNPNFSQQIAYYKEIDDLQAAINALARWTIGKGFSSNEITEMTLSTIKGHGKDTFNTILENQTRIAKIAGDSFAHIIRDDEGNLINLKPLNPGVMQIVADRAGLIIRYEQLDRNPKKAPKRFEPNEIFHLSRNRVADEIHGVSLIDSVKEIILMRKEAMADYKLALHRNVYPVRIWHLDTDDDTEIAAFKAKADKAGYQGENIYIPKGVVETELAGVPPNATMNPLPWIASLTQDFWKATGCPQIIVGGSAEFTEATAKIAYLAFEQTIEEEQLYLEEQVLSQLNLEIELEFPATLQNEMLSDQGKAESMQATTPEDTAVTNVGVNQ